MNEDKLEKIIMETVDIPSLPPVAMKVLQLMNDSFSSVNELEKLIEKDQSFSSRLLRIANSPYYGRGRAVDSVSTAIILIGFNTMKNLVVAASMKDLNRKFGLFEQKLWEHSLAVSIAASAIARQTKLVKADEALVAGLIHDVGKTVLNNGMSEQYSRVIEKVYEEGLQFIDVENDMLGFNHCSVGGLIARKWKIPKNLETVIEYHHAKPFPDFEDNTYETLCMVIGVADSMCLYLGIGMSREIPIEGIGFENVGLTEDQYKTLQEDVITSYNEQREQLLK